LIRKLVRPVGSIRRGCGSGCRWRGLYSTTPKFSYLMSLFLNVTCTRGEMVRLLRDPRPGTTIFIRDAPAALSGRRGGQFVWMEAGKIVERTLDLKRLEKHWGEHRGEQTMSAPFRPSLALRCSRIAAGVEVEGCGQLHAVFSLLVVVVFSFSFDPSAEESRQIAGG